MTNSNPSELAIEIEKLLNETVAPRKIEWCIYRVPDDLREVNRDAYTPRVVSIGPLHYGNERLQNMEIHKRVYLQQFIKRNAANLNDLISFIEELEPSVRHCYAEDVMFTRKQLVKIILLDACFISELFLRDYEGGWPKDDPLSPETRLSSFILFDLLLLENQLPFFVLQKLFNWVFLSRKSSEFPSFLELTFKYFTVWNQQWLSHDSVNICHFADLLRYFYLQQPSSLRPERGYDEPEIPFTATKLHEAGLRFQVNDQSECLLELQLSSRVLKIPKIWVMEQTGILFHNMVAFEQCHCPYESYITDYVAIFYSLVRTGKDADVLIRSGIIENHLDDSDAVAKMFNGLGKNIKHRSFNYDYFLLGRGLNEFCRDPWQKLMATFRHDYCAELKRDYCRTPLQCVATIGGILLIALTVIQTICSIIQVVQKS